jgi:hypothetical protein
MTTISISNWTVILVMNRNTTYALFGVTFALVASGMVGSNLLSAQPSGLVAQDTPIANDGMKISGHVTTIATDESGHIKAYRQTDNVVVNTGKDCVTRLLFGGTTGTGRGLNSGTTTCIGGLNAPWDSIAVGNRTTAITVGTTNSSLTHEAASGNGLSRQLGTVTYTNATGSSSSITVIQTTFGPLTGLGAGGTQVTESGLFNSTTVNAGGMFAHQAISSIALNTGDSLTIKWTINVG